MYALCNYNLKKYTQDYFQVDANIRSIQTQTYKKGLFRNMVLRKKSGCYSKASKLLHLMNTYFIYKTINTTYSPNFQ